MLFWQMAVDYFVVFPGIHIAQRIDRGSQPSDGPKQINLRCWIFID